jgi:hypothetical protein
MSDFKTNEKKIMQELDTLAKNADTRKKKGKGDMAGAVEGTEAIREWQDQMWDRARLEKEYQTDFE